MVGLPRYYDEVMGGSLAGVLGTGPGPGTGSGSGSGSVPR